MATIGYTSIGGSTDTAAANWQPEASIGASERYTGVTGDTVTQVAVYGAGTGTVTVGIYVYSGGVPTTRVGSAVSVSVGATAGWYTASASIALTNGVVYCVALDPYEDEAWTYYYDAGGGTYSLHTTGNPTSLPASWTQSSSGTGRMSVYATVTAGSSGASVSATVVTAAASVPAPTVAVGSTVTATVVTAVASVPAPTVSTAANANVTATVVTALASVPSPTVSVGVTVTATAVTATASVPAPSVTAINFPYPASVSGREILDQFGNPWPVQGAAVWTAPQNLTDANITTLLEGAAAQGLNSVMMAPCGLLWNDPAGTAAANRYENYAGDPFFTGTAFASSLGSAWSSVDHFMDEAVRLELTVFFCWYAGNLSTYGQSDEWVAATNAQVRTVGSDVATRYPVSVYPNLVWVFGADAAFSAASTIGQRLDSIARGIADVETSRLTVAHPDKRDNGTYDSGRDQFGTGYTYLTIDINSIYSYQDDFADQFDSVYAEASVPVINIEPVYAHNTGQEPGSAPVSHGTGEGSHLREQAWVAFARGGNGIMHGDEDLWPFGATGLYSGGGTWQQVLDHAAGTHDNPLIWLGHLWDFLAANPSWSDLVPDADTFLTSGEGTVNNRASAGLAGDLAIVYFPNTRGSIVVDTTQLTGTGNVRLRWYDPTDGSYTSISASEAQNASRSITYPTTNTNANSSDDWVLVVDLLGDSSVSATVVTATASVPAPTVSASASVTATVVTALADVPAPTAGAGVGITATVVTATASVPSPSVTAGGAVDVTATVVTAPASVPAPTVSVGVTITATVVTALADVPSATASAGASLTATVVTGAADVPTPSVSAGGSANVNATVVTALASVPTPTLSAGSTVTASVVTAVGSVLSVTVVAGAVAAIYGPALTAAPPPILTWSPPPILKGRSA